MTTLQRPIAWLKYVGTTVTIASLVFVGHRLATSGITSSPIWKDTSVWPCLLAAATFYAIALALTVIAWRDILATISTVVLPWKNTFQISSRFQIYKYLPGNVFHFAGRHIFLRAHGIGHTPLAVTTLSEALALILAALLTICFCDLPSWMEQNGKFEFSRYLAPAALLLLLALVGIGLFHRYSRPSSPTQLLWRILGTPFQRRILRALTLDFLFFFASGFIMAQVISTLAGSTLPIRPFLSLWAASWLAGFVTPGSPAGLGVRDALFIAGLEHFHLSSDAVSYALVARCVTMFGDTIFALAASILACWFIDPQTTAQKESGIASRNIT